MGVIFYLKLVHLRFRNYSILFYLYSDSTVSKKSDYSPILPFKMTSTKNVRLLFGSLMAREVKIFIFAYLAIKLPSNAHIVYRNIMIRLKKKYPFTAFGKFQLTGQFIPKLCSPFHLKLFLRTKIEKIFFACCFLLYIMQELFQISIKLILFWEFFYCYRFLSEKVLLQR